MAAEENKRVVEELMEGFNDADFDQIEGIFAEDYVNHSPIPMPGATPDRAGQLAAMRAYREAFPDARVEPRHVISEGDLVVLHDVVTGTHEGPLGEVPATGKRAETEFIHIFRIADGKIVERWGLMDMMGLMAQLEVAAA
jgi:steroid delta-isomerase-like uncharacterized protein